MTADGFAIYLVSIACAVIGGLFVVIAPAFVWATWMFMAAEFLRQALETVVPS